MSVTPGPKTVAARMKILFHYLHQHQHGRHLHHPVFDCGYAQRTLAPVGFGNIDPSYRAGPVGLGLEFRLQRVQPLPLLLRAARDAVEGLSIHPRSTPVSRHPAERVLQQVGAHDVSVETPEPIFRFGFGFAIECALELPNFLRSCYFRLTGTISLSFAPLSHVRTSRVPSPRLLPASILRADAPKIEPVPVRVTMNSSDCGTDTRRLTGRASL